MNSSVSKFGVTLLALLLSLGAFRAVLAQDGNAQAGGQNGLVSEETLSTTSFDMQTTSSRKARFARLTLTEHGTVRLAASEDPSFFFLEQGSWEVQLDSKSGTTPTNPVLMNAVPLAPDTAGKLGPGGWLSLPPRSAVQVSNQDSAPGSIPVGNLFRSIDGNKRKWRHVAFIRRPSRGAGRDE